MRYGPLATLVVLILLSCPVVISDTVMADNEGEKPVEPVEPLDITIRGFVGDISTEGNVPLNNVRVQLLDMNGNLTAICLTGNGDLEAGEFRFTYPKDRGTYLTFSMEGYTTRTWSDAMTLVDNNMFSFRLDGLTPDESGCYNLTSDMDGGSFVAMRMTTAHIVGYVHDEDGSPIKGADVTVTSSDNRIVTGSTDSNGYFEVSCYYGTYTITVSCRGFESPEPITIGTTDAPPTIIMEKKNHTMMWGLDTAHALELVGILAVALSIVVMYFIYHRSKAEDSEIVIINDLDEVEEGEDEVNP